MVTTDMSEMKTKACLNRKPYTSSKNFLANAQGVFTVSCGTQLKWVLCADCAGLKRVGSFSTFTL